MTIFVCALEWFLSPRFNVFLVVPFYLFLVITFVTICVEITTKLECLVPLLVLGQGLKQIFLLTRLVFHSPGDKKRLCRIFCHLYLCDRICIQAFPPVF